MHDDLPELYRRANDAYNAGQWGVASQWADACLAKDPSHPDVLHLKGLVALAQDDPVQAEHWFLQTVARSPSPSFLNSLCVAQTHLRAFDRAAQTARIAIELSRQQDPPLDCSILLFNLGRALQLAQHFAQASDAYREALEHDPRHTGALNNLGVTLNELGRPQDAIGQFRQAVAVAPDNIEAHNNLGQALLAAGEYEQAWPHFEHRRAGIQNRVTGRAVRMPDAPPLPQWRGEPPSAGRDRLLILEEQGFGDTLQFCRYIPMALERFAKVTLVARAPLRRLLVDSFGQRWSHFEFIDSSAPPADFHAWDWFANLMSLPMAFRTVLDNIPATIPYLFAEPRAVAHWRKRVSDACGPARPRIGIVWAGSDYIPDVDVKRSMPTEQIDALIAWPHARWISLQKATSDAKRLMPHQRARVVDWMDEMHDFADTAALVASLDLVICVDTSVAHLAGAIGKPVWLLNRFYGCWRWLREREDTPWYPGMRLFTQTAPGDWHEVVTRVIAELEKARGNGSFPA